MSDTNGLTDAEVIRLIEESGALLAAYEPRVWLVNLKDVRALLATQAKAPAVAGEAARSLENCPELNMAHYDSVDVNRLNDWAIRADAEIDRLYAQPVAKPPTKPYIATAPTRAGWVYLAGPMTGIAEYNFPAFNAAAAALRAEGLSVVNPADHGVQEGVEWADYLRYDLTKIAHCESIALLPGWSHSKGARLEVHVARALGMPVRFLPGAEAEPASPQAQGDAPEPTPPFGSKRAAALALYKPPFKFRMGYIHDAGGHMVADQDGFGEGSKVFDSIAARVRGWGRIGYLPDAEALQDEVGAVIADALTAYWAAAPQPQQEQSK